MAARSDVTSAVSTADVVVAVGVFFSCEDSRAISLSLASKSVLRRSSASSLSFLDARAASLNVATSASSCVDLSFPDVSLCSNASTLAAMAAAAASLSRSAAPRSLNASRAASRSFSTVAAADKTERTESRESDSAEGSWKERSPPMPTTPVAFGTSVVVSLSRAVAARRGRDEESSPNNVASASASSNLSPSSDALCAICRSASTAAKV
mmetsp:Transcript_60543/g.131387  ORF Transcript_60543/g.131387 Transcript_60543/m.131387 type:complete len:210 (-) Transcript_60543:30-659(-)